MTSRRLFAVACLAAFALAGGALAQSTTPRPAQLAPAPASQPMPSPGQENWPRSLQLDGATYTIYQPQLDSWDMATMTAHAAVSVQEQGAPVPTFGAVNLTAKTRVDRLARTVHVSDVAVGSASFPSAPAQAARYRDTFQALFGQGPLTLSLDRAEAALAMLNAQNQAKAVPVQNPVPQFVFSPAPAVLVSIDGEPAWRPVQGTAYERVLNTRPLLLRERSGTVYFHLFDGFLKAPGLAGPWTVAKMVPPGIARAAADLGKTGVVDLMEGPPNDKTGKKPSLSTGAPQVIVAVRPTELIVTNGAPQWTALEGTGTLSYVVNTDANVFTDATTQRIYVLASGRWFAAAGLSGPWTYVAAKDLPPSFARIPDDSAKENVKAAIPGTPQAKEALIAAQIPQTAQVERAKAAFTLQLPAAPEIRPIEGTTLRYVVNAPVPVIQLPSGPWYALDKAVWFNAPSLQGPWSVASSVPPEIYAIPPDSPLYYATYVRIYDTTPTTVTVGYLPGYMGSYVADGVVVYGTGYAYPPYIGTTVWYGAPVTYGYAAAMAWTPWTGWAYGYGMGWAYGAAWGTAAWGWAAAPYWGGYYGAAWGANGYAAWGPNGWAATSGNVYHQWGSTTAVTRSSAGYNAWTGNAWSGETGHSYNSTTGRISAGQSGTVGNVYSGNYATGTRAATYNPNTGVSASAAKGTVGNAYTGQSTDVARASVSGPGGNEASAATVGNNHYADVNGNVYKNTGSGWEQHDSGGGWSSVNTDTAKSMDSERDARSSAEQRTRASSSGSFERSGGGGFDRSGGRSGGGRGRR